MHGTAASRAAAQGVTVVPGGKAPDAPWDESSIWVIVVLLLPILFFLTIRLAKWLSERGRREQPPS
jgi:hypothetical protein